jgi:hypothetical protein
MTIADPMSKSPHPLHPRKDPDMQHVEQRLREVQEHQARFREQRQAERVASAAAQAERRTVRRQVGERIIRVGRRVAGEALGSPALSR